jgi:hypothetical protein
LRRTCLGMSDTHRRTHAPTATHPHTHTHPHTQRTTYLLGNKREVLDMMHHWDHLNNGLALKMLIKYLAFKMLITLPVKCSSPCP